MSQIETDRLTEVVVRRFRERSLRAAIKSEQALEATLRQMAPRLRRRLRAIGFSAAEVETIIVEEFAATRAARAAAVEEAMGISARAAVDADDAIAAGAARQGAAATAVPFSRRPPSGRQRATLRLLPSRPAAGSPASTQRRSSTLTGPRWCGPSRRQAARADA